MIADNRPQECKGASMMVAGTERFLGLGFWISGVYLGSLSLKVPVILDGAGAFFASIISCGNCYYSARVQGLFLLLSSFVVTVITVHENSSSS